MIVFLFSFGSFGVLGSPLRDYRPNGLSPCRERETKGSVTAVTGGYSK